MTRGDVLKYAIAFALRRVRKVVHGLTDAQRYWVAEHVVQQLKDRGGPSRPSDEAKPPGEPTT